MNRPGRTALAHRRSARIDLLDRGDQFRRRRLLEHVPRRPGGEGIKDVFRVLVHGQHDDLRSGHLRLELARTFHAVTLVAGAASGAVLRLDDIEADLICSVTHVAGDALSAMYRFSVSAEQRILLRGRASVVLDAKRLTRSDQ